VPDPSAVTTFLFTDIEGSTRLWEQEPERMQPALARHDAVSRAIVEENGGSVVKTTGDGIHAVFEDPLAAVAATLQLQLTYADPVAAGEIPLKIRCGLHLGEHQRRDNDFYGSTVNRAARIMSAAHGGQVLLSEAVASRVEGRLPAGAAVLDLGSVRLRDLARPEHVYQLVHPSLRREFPALRSLEATPNNLAQQLNSFVGRELELAKARQLLGTARLLTLLGVGGIGKSRLSVQLAAEVLDDFPDGVWLVELAPLTDSRHVVQAVASVLGVHEESRHSITEALLEHVRDRRLLVVLDNCEHVVQACAELAKQMLQASPGLRMLATSRSYLQIAGETAYHVPTLAVPDPNQRIEAGELQQHDAVRLFVDRAAASHPSFQITPRNARAVVDICRRLDGIPLAIELAAARTRALPVEVIAARLDDRFRLLATGDLTVLPRQRTLRALIDWSYDLLTPGERRLFVRLAVFAGGWTIEAAEAVAAGDGLDQADVLDALAQLVEKSLAVLEPDSGRYRMLDTVRHYARDRMTEIGDASPVQERHLRYYLGLAERAHPHLAGPDQKTWLARLDPELENMLAAIAWSEHSPQGAEKAVALTRSLRPYWTNRGLWTLARQVTVEIVGRAELQGPTDLRRRALFFAGQVCFFMARYSEAKAYLTESLAIARQLGDVAAVGEVLQPLGSVCLGLGETAAADDLLVEALALARKLGNKPELAGALNQLAQLYRMQGRLEAAEPLYLEMVALERELGDMENTAIGMLNLAILAIGLGSVDRARTLLLDVLGICGRIHSRPVEVSTLDVCAGLAATAGQWDRAARYEGIVAAQMAATGIQRDPSDEAFLSPLIANARGALGESVFAELAASGGSWRLEQALADAGDWLKSDRS
jgi:predicted ATPase/class 3 adenylate cyclase